MTYCTFKKGDLVRLRKKHPDNKFSMGTDPLWMRQPQPEIVGKYKTYRYYMNEPAMLYLGCRGRVHIFLHKGKKWNFCVKANTEIEDYFRKVEGSDDYPWENY